MKKTIIDVTKINGFKKIDSNGERKRNIPILNFGYSTFWSYIENSWKMTRTDLLFETYQDFSNKMNELKLDWNNISNSLIPVSAGKNDYAFIFDNVQLVQIQNESKTTNYYEKIFLELILLNETLIKNKMFINSAIAIGDIISIGDHLLDKFVEHFESKNIYLDKCYYRKAGYSVLGFSNLTYNIAIKISEWLSKTFKIQMLKIENELDEFIFPTNVFEQKENFILQTLVKMESMG